jgi:hypothetical protein
MIFKTEVLIAVFSISINKVIDHIESSVSRTAQEDLVAVKVGTSYCPAWRSSSMSDADLNLTGFDYVMFTK